MTIDLVASNSPEYWADKYREARAEVERVREENERLVELVAFREEQALDRYRDRNKARNRAAWLEDYNSTEVARLRRIEDAATEAAHKVDGLEGLTAQQMMMRGVSPVKLLAEIRDALRTVLEEK